MSDEYKAKLKSLQMRGSSTRKGSRSAERIRDYVEGNSKQEANRRDQIKRQQQINRTLDPKWFDAERGSPESVKLELPDRRP